MTKFILCNISVFNSVDDKNLNTSFFKTAAFNARINNKKISKINYNLVLVPYKFYSEQKYDKEKINNFKQKCSIPKNTNDYNIIYSLYEILKTIKKQNVIFFTNTNQTNYCGINDSTICALKCED